MKTKQPSRSWEVCILAGGLSSRLGRDKAELRLGGQTLLSHARAAAEALGLAVRVIRRDLVPRCGPLGGIYTALTTTRARSVLFLCCDMPFVPEMFLRRLLERSSPNGRGVFTVLDGRAGFPFLLNMSALQQVERMLEQKQHSLQTLAKNLRARRIQPTKIEGESLLNINTPDDWAQARRLWEARSTSKPERSTDQTRAL